MFFLDPLEGTEIRERVSAMHGRRRNEAENQPVLYNQNTEETFIGITAPLPPVVPLSFWQRLLRGIGNFFSAVVRKINQFLAFALIVLLLLLLTRFLLRFFGVHDTGINLFAQWTFMLSDPLIAPFDHLFAPLPYQGDSIDVTTTIAIVVYTVSVIIVRQFLKLLVSRPK